MNTNNGGNSNQNKSTYLAAAIGAVIGSVVTFTLPKIWDYSTRPAPILQVTPKELIASFRKIDNKLQAEESARNFYYGKYVTWTGTIEDVDSGSPGFGPFSHGTVSVMCPDFWAEVSRNDNAVPSLKKGKKITVKGRIYLMSDSNVWIRNCTILKVQ